MVPRSRRSFRTLYCLVLVISATLLWQSYRSYTTATLQKQYHQAQIDILETNEKTIERLRVDYLPWEGIANVEGRAGHRSHLRTNDDQSLVRGGEPASIHVQLSPPSPISFTRQASQLAIVERQTYSGSVLGTAENQHASHSVPRNDDQILLEPQDQHQSKDTSAVFLDPNIAAIHPGGQTAYELPEPSPLRSSTVWSGSYRFPSWDACERVEEKADLLPDLVVVPFEDAVDDVNLQGWEDDWISMAHFTGPKLGEPKIDFVYNCKPTRDYTLFV